MGKRDLRTNASRSAEAAKGRTTEKIFY